MTGRRPLRRRARSAAALAALAATIAFPTADAIAASAVAGRQKAGACVACHGEDGISVQPNVPHLAGQPEIYVAEQLRLYRSGRRANEVMAVIAKPLSDADIDDLAAWFAAIKVEATARDSASRGPDSVPSAHPRGRNDRRGAIPAPGPDPSVDARKAPA